MLSMYFSQILALFKSPIFLSALLSWFLCQLTKSILAFIVSPREKKVKNFLKRFGSTGGMPSSHSAVVISLTLSVGFKEGFNSTFFIIAFFLASIVIRDAVGVRLSNGIQAKALNLLGGKVSKKLDINFTPVQEVNGHTKSEVIVGAIIGVFTTIIFVNIL